MFLVEETPEEFQKKLIALCILSLQECQQMTLSRRIEAEKKSSNLHPQLMAHVKCDQEAQNQVFRGLE